MQGAASPSSHTATMQRHQKPTNLTINSKSAIEAAQTSTGPNSSPIHLEGVDLSSFGGEFGGGALTSLPPLPSSPPTSPGHRRAASKNILNSFKSRSNEQSKGGLRQVKDESDANRPGSSSMAKIYQLKKSPGSTPELSLLGSAEKVDRPTEDGESYCELAYHDDGARGRSASRSRHRCENRSSHGLICHLLVALKLHLTTTTRHDHRDHNSLCSVWLPHRRCWILSLSLSTVWPAR